MIFNPSLTNNASLFQALGGWPLFVYMRTHNLKQLLIHNGMHNTDMYRDGAWALLCTQMPVLCSHLLWWQNYKPDCHLTVSRTCLLVALLMWSMPFFANSAPLPLYTGQTEQCMCKRMNGHKSVTNNGNILKTVSEQFNLPGCSLNDLKVTGGDTL